jgi:hypothetical protein
MDPSWITAQWALFVLSCAVPLVLGWTAWALFGIHVASLSVILTSFYFPWVDFFAFFLSEAAFIPATVGAFALLVLALRTRHRSAGILPGIASGTMFGLAASVKTVALASAALLALILLWWQWRRGVPRLYRVVGCLALGLLPVLLAVGHRCTKANEGHFCLVSNNGPLTTIFGHTPWVRSIAWNDSARGMRWGWGCPVSAQRVMFDRDLSFDFPPYDSKANFAKIVDLVRKDPLETLELSFDQVCNLFYGTIPWPSSATKWTRWALESEQLFLGVGIVPALFHLRARARSVLTLNPSAASEILLCVPIVALVVTCFLTQGDPRYRIPLDGFIIVLASAEILRWLGVRDQVSWLANVGNARTVALPRQVDGLTNDVQGAALHLFEDAADVLAENANHQELNARE